MGRNGEWLHDKAWADNHLNCVNEVIRSVAGRIITIEESPLHQDMHEAIDYKVEVASGEVACRIRRAARCHYRDLTMTANRPSGNRSEIEKILQGSVRWYLYAWADAGRFIEWMFVDLDVLREKQLIHSALAKKQKRRGADGSEFIWITAAELEANGAIIQSDLNPESFRQTG